MAVSEPTPQDITQELYKRNAELAIKNKTLSLLDKLYEISILTLDLAPLAERITQTIQSELNFDLVGIFFRRNDQIDELTPLHFAKSARLTEALGRDNQAFDEVKISGASRHALFGPILLGSGMSYTENFVDIWDGLIPRDTFVKAKTEAHLRTVLLYPLAIENGKILGILMLGLNRAYNDLGKFERESVHNFVNVIATALDKALLYQELQVSNQKLADVNDDLNQANEILKELDVLKSEFISMAGHQLRGPMTIIKGYISLILEGTIKGAPAAVREALGKAMFSTDQLIKLVSSLLDLSRIEAGKIKYEMVEGDLAHIVAEVIDKFKPNMEKKGLAVVFENSAGEAQFLFDQDKIREVAVNYLDNAIKYSEKGKIVVLLERVGSGVDAGIRFSIKDLGLGVKQEDIPKLFDKFVRTDEAKKKDPNGIGIGLYFAKRVVQDHHGRVGASSQGIGKGSIFWFELPMKIMSKDANGN